MTDALMRPTPCASCALAQEATPPDHYLRCTWLERDVPFWAEYWRSGGGKMVVREEPDWYGRKEIVCSVWIGRD